MSKDTIYRQAAIDAFDCTNELIVSGETNARNVVSYINKVVGKIKALPPAHPERKKGKWIYGEDEYGIDGYHCDTCGFFVPWDYAHTFINYIESYNFCPSCGADMRGGEDENN